MTVTSTRAWERILGPGSVYTFEMEYSDISQLSVTKAGVTMTTPGQYQIDGQEITFSPALLSSEIVLIRRLTDKMQNVDLVENDALVASTIDSALDRVTMMVQEAKGNTQLAIGGPTDILMPAPEANLALVGKADGSGWEHKSLDELFGTGSVVVPVASGGTNATTAAAARTNLGLGTCSVRDVGDEEGDVPLLGAGDVVAVATLTPVSSSSAGVLAAYGTAGFVPYLSGSVARWAVPATPIPLKEAVGSSTAALSCAASGSEWDGYARFRFAVYGVPSAVSMYPAFRFNVGGSIISTANYWSALHESVGGAGVLQVYGGNGTTEIYAARNSTAGMRTAGGGKDLFNAVGEIWQEPGSSTNPIIIQWHYSLHSGDNYSRSGFGGGRLAVVSGRFRGLQLIATANNFTSARVRIWGLTEQSFPA